MKVERTKKLRGIAQCFAVLLLFGGLLGAVGCALGCPNRPISLDRFLDLSYWLETQ